MQRNSLKHVLASGMRSVRIGTSLRKSKSRSRGKSGKGKQGLDVVVAGAGVKGDEGGHVSRDSNDGADVGILKRIELEHAVAVSQVAHQSSNPF